MILCDKLQVCSGQFIVFEREDFRTFDSDTFPENQRQRIKPFNYLKEYKNKIKK